MKCPGESPTQRRLDARPANRGRPSAHRASGGEGTATETVEWLKGPLGGSSHGSSSWLVTGWLVV